MDLIRLAYSTIRIAEATAYPPLHVTDTAPQRDRPVMLVYGGGFNPPHTGHVGALQDAQDVLSQAGYNVQGSIVAPTADKLLAKKQMDPVYKLDLPARARLAESIFPKDINGVPVQVSTGPSEEVEAAEGKPRRTDLANWVQRRYPEHTVINVTGEDASVPGEPGVFPSLYTGEIGSNHEGYAYLTMPRPETSMSSSAIRAAMAAGQPIPGMTPESEHAYREELDKRKARHMDPIMAAYKAIRFAAEEEKKHPSSPNWDVQAFMMSLWDPPVEDWDNPFGGISKGLDYHDELSKARAAARYAYRVLAADARWREAARRAVGARPDWYSDAQYRADILRKLYQNAIHGDPGVTARDSLADEDEPRSGTMVSIPGSERVGPTMPSSAELKNFQNEFREELADPRNDYGGWEYPKATDQGEGVPRYYQDISRLHSDPWEAAGEALKGNQIGVYNYDGYWDPQGKPSYVDTNQFFNDQIAKGGSRMRGLGNDYKRAPQRSRTAAQIRGQMAQPGSGGTTGTRQRSPRTSHSRKESYGLRTQDRDAVHGGTLRKVGYFNEHYTLDQDAKCPGCGHALKEHGFPKGKAKNDPNVIGGKCFCSEELPGPDDDPTNTTMHACPCTRFEGKRP